MREFNTFGPVYPDKHYHVDRKSVKADLRDRIERGRYLTLNAGRQTGKTTIFREVIDELEATSEYFGVLIERSKYQEGQEQLVRYLNSAGLGTGYLLVFDENLAQNPITAEKGEVFELSIDEKVVNVYFVSVEV